MFKIVKSESYTWPVDVRIPIDGGRFESHTFDVKFRRHDRDGVEAVRKSFADPSTDVAQIAREIVIGWDGVSDESGAMPFSAGALDTVLKIQGVAPAIVGAFLASAYGVDRKN